MMADTLLLATFCKARDVKTTIDLITDEFEVVGGKIFVLQDESDRYKKILTYNTLYTLNALNEVVREQNGGNEDPKFSVDWEPHRNTLLVTYKDDESGEQFLRRIETRLISIVNLDEDN